MSSRAHHRMPSDRNTISFPPDHAVEMSAFAASRIAGNIGPAFLHSDGTSRTLFVKAVKSLVQLKRRTQRTYRAAHLFIHGVSPPFTKRPSEISLRPAKVD